MKPNTVAGPRPICTALPHFHCVLNVQISLRAAVRGVNRVRNFIGIRLVLMETVPAPGSRGESNRVYNRGSSRNLNGRCATGDVARMAPILLWLVMVLCLLI